MLKRIFTILLIIFPILFIYGSPVSGITLADILLLIIIPFLIFDIIKNKKKVIIYKPLMIVSIYIIIQLLVVVLFSNYDSNTQNLVFSTLRLILYYMTLVIFTGIYFDIKFALNVYRKVAMFVCCFLFLQIFAEYILGIYIPGTISLPGFSISESLTEYNEKKSLENNNDRLMSVFNEPSHMAIYVSLILAIELLYGKKINTRVVVYTIALLLSGSSTGILMAIIIFILYFGLNLRNFSKKTIINVIILVLVMLIIIPIYIRTSAFQVFYERTFVNESAVTGRFGKYSLAFESNNNIINMFFGSGIFKEIKSGYIPSFPRIYLYFGILGIIYFIGKSIKNFIMLKDIQWITWLVLFILAFPTEMIFGSFMLLYMPFIISNVKIEN